MGAIPLSHSSPSPPPTLELGLLVSSCSLQYAQYFSTTRPLHYCPPVWNTRFTPAPSVIGILLPEPVRSESSSKRAPAPVTSFVSWPSPPKSTYRRLVYLSEWSTVSLTSQDCNTLWKLSFTAILIIPGMNQVLLNNICWVNYIPALNFINRLTTEQSNFCALSQCSQNAWCLVKNTENLGFPSGIGCYSIVKKKKKSSKALIILSPYYFSYL